MGLLFFGLPLQDLLNAYPAEMRNVLTDLATVLVQNVEEWSKPEPILDEKSGKIGYKEKDEVSYDVSYSNKTAFAYLNFEKYGKLTPEQVREQVAIDLICGRFSFADLPCSYRCILGVTGTLNDLRRIAGFDNMLRGEYGFKHFTITPSIFGAGRLVFNPGEHVHVLDEEADWCLCIERLVEEHTRKGDSVLVFFKNETEMKKYRGQFLGALKGASNQITLLEKQHCMFFFHRKMLSVFMPGLCHLRYRW